MVIKQSREYINSEESGKHNYILDLPYPISERSGSSLVMSGIEIGGILAVGVDLYVSWKNGTTYGIDKLDYSNKMEAGYLETRLIVIEREKFSIFPKFVVAYASLPASTAITIQYSKNYTAYADTTEVTDTARLIVQSQESVEATTLQIKVLPTVSGNSAPEIESMGLFPI